MNTMNKRVQLESYTSMDREGQVEEQGKVTKGDNVLPFDWAKVSESDYEVTQHVINGNKPIFEVLIRRYNNRLFRIARSILKQDEDAIDVVQESWIKIYSVLNQFNGPDGFGSWVSRITYNNALMKLRKPDLMDYHGELDMEENSSKFSATSAQYEPLDNLAQRQLSALLEQAIDRLPNTYRSVFMMRAIEQLNTQDTADSRIGC